MQAISVDFSTVIGDAKRLYSRCVGYYWIIFILKYYYYHVRTVHTKMQFNNTMVNRTTFTFVL